MNHYIQHSFIKTSHCIKYPIQPYQQQHQQQQQQGVPQSLSNFNLTSIFPEINTAVVPTDSSGKHLKGSQPPPAPTSIQGGQLIRTEETNMMKQEGSGPIDLLATHLILTVS